MNIISLDLEMNQPSNTIIQVGAVVGNLSTGQIFETLNFYTNTDEKITDYIRTLTKIDNDVLMEKGQSLVSIYNQLKKVHNYYDCFRNPLTWGGGDSLLLKKQLLLKDEQIDWVFGDRWLDSKTVFQTYCVANNIKPQSGLAKSMTKLGLRFIGTKHNAMDDAKNTFVIMHELIRRMKHDGGV